MKKILISFVAIIMMITTVAFATEEELENAILLTAPGLEDVEDIMMINKNDMGNEEIFTTSEPCFTEYDDADKVIEDDLYIIQDNVIINSSVDGNIYVLGKDVIINSESVSGNVFVLGENITINNTKIDGALYAISESLNFNGEANFIYALSSNISFSENSKCNKNLKLLGTNIELNGSVEKNVTALANEITMGKDAKIAGEFTYYSVNQAIINKDAKVNEINFKKIENNTEPKKDTAQVISNYINKTLSTFIKALLISWILICGIKKFGNLKRSENVIVDTLKNFGWGLLAIIIIPIVSLILLCTGICTGIGILGFVAYCIMLYIAKIAFAVEIANRIKLSNSGNGSQILLSAFITLLIWAIGYITVLGPIVNFVTFIAGLGIIWNLIFQKNKKIEA